MRSMTIYEDQIWNSHFWGKNGLMTALNKRLYTIKRLANHIPRDKLKEVDSLWTSKLGYGLQLCAKVRLSEEEKTDRNMKMVQIVQNKMLRILDYSLTKDRRSKKIKL